MVKRKDNVEREAETRTEQEDPGQKEGSCQSRLQEMGGSGQKPTSLQGQMKVIQNVGS